MTKRCAFCFGASSLFLLRTLWEFDGHFVRENFQILSFPRNFLAFCPLPHYCSRIDPYPFVLVP
jgi:hypothetical protein